MQGRRKVRPTRTPEIGAIGAAFARAKYHPLRLHMRLIGERPYKGVAVDWFGWIGDLLGVGLIKDIFSFFTIQNGCKWKWDGWRKKQRYIPNLPNFTPLMAERQGELVPIAKDEFYFIFCQQASSSSTTGEEKWPINGSAQFYRLGLKQKKSFASFYEFLKSTFNRRNKNLARAKCPSRFLLCKCLYLQNPRKLLFFSKLILTQITKLLQSPVQQV